ncbi:hypothetical protein JOF56_003027 [Kibdelosporangium banguiense]|uniref:Nucleotidyltransferase domain-containing protein n=1 Tax=Kibdelosporangium banguiense TaxID=1365924 RepID=A0ABS4TDZ9_9PSEU|nr:hypothetical protein [Kibdelosporangium banguiense]MBP2322642.1 hypothetical protein [Kibdelosporangium banguiense]
MEDAVPNQTLTQARAVMQPFLDALAAKPDVQAVLVLSSSACTSANPTHFDEESDFDISLVLDIPMAASEWRPRRSDTYQLLADRIPDWVPNFLFHVPVPWGRMEVNVHQMIYQYEADPRTVWNGDKCDAYLNKREVIADREGRFQQLVDEKARRSLSQLADEHVRLANRLTWDITTMPFRQARRLGSSSGHHILNVAIDEVIDCVYAMSGLLIPNRKWKLAHLVSRSLISIEQAELLQEAIRCDPTSMSDLKRRVRALTAFCQSVDGLATTGPAAARHRRGYYSRIQLRERTFADAVSDEVEASLADVTRDVVNFSLCGSSVDLVACLASSLPESWRTVAPVVSAHLKQVID